MSISSLRVLYRESVNDVNLDLYLEDQPQISGVRLHTTAAWWLIVQVYRWAAAPLERRWCARFGHQVVEPVGDPRYDSAWCSRCGRNLP